MNQVTPPPQRWFVYVVLCGDGTLYTGITTDTVRRLDEHNRGAPLGARYTRSRRPVTLAYVEGAADRGIATRREHAIKKLDRRSKMALCNLLNPFDPSCS